MKAYKVVRWTGVLGFILSLVYLQTTTVGSNSFTYGMASIFVSLGFCFVSGVMQALTTDTMNFRNSIIQREKHPARFWVWFSVAGITSLVCSFASVLAFMRATS